MKTRRDNPRMMLGIMSPVYSIRLRNGFVLKRYRTIASAAGNPNAGEIPVTTRPMPMLFESAPIIAVPPNRDEAPWQPGGGTYPRSGGALQTKGVLWWLKEKRVTLKGGK